VRTTFGKVVLSGGAMMAKVRFNQVPTAPILLGGSLIVAGGAVIMFWTGDQA
jgi:hypothetical protein